MTKTPLPASVTDAESIEAAARALGAALELEGSAPFPATQRALADPKFAQALWAVRKMPSVLRQLLLAPHTARLRSIEDTSVPGPESREVLTKGAGSVLKWGMKGLKHARPWQIKDRLAACNACEFQIPAPDTLIYRGAKVVAGKDAKICEKCSCLTNTKAAMATEHCPERDPQNPDLSRWGEPYVAPKDRSNGPW